MISTRCFRKLAVVLVLLFFAGVGEAPAFQLGGRPAAEWIATLERPERIAGLKIEEILTRLALKPGMVVADIGSGSGVFSRPIAKAVVPGGKVIAVDIDAGLLSYIKERAAKEDIPNIETHLAEYDDATLPGQVVDLVLFHDVLHHIEHRDVYLKNLAKYIMPGGRVAVIEMDPSDPESTHHNQHEMLITRDQINLWMEAAGLHLAAGIPLFPGKKLFLIYARPDLPAQPMDSMDGMDMGGMDMGGM